MNPLNKERRATLRDKQYGSEAFQAWCHRQVCQIPGCVHRDVEMSHAKSRAAGGMWTDVAILCGNHHHESHQLGVLSFEAKYGLSLHDLAAAVQRAWRESR